jgi:hypothetical protein
LKKSEEKIKSMDEFDDEKDADIEIEVEEKKL